MIRKTINGLNGLLARSLELTDWDADGFFDVIAAFSSGDVISFTLTPATLVIEEVPVNPGPINQISIEDFNKDSFEDILLLSSDMRSLTLFSGKDGIVEALKGVMNNVPSGTQVFCLSPLSKSGLYTGNVLLAGWNGKENSLYVVNVGQGAEQLNQSFIISSDFISKIPDLLGSLKDDKPEIPDVFVEISPEISVPLEPKKKKKLF